MNSGRNRKLAEPFSDAEGLEAQVQVLRRHLRAGKEAGGGGEWTEIWPTFSPVLRATCACIQA
jgi:hypothetical protein